MTRKAFDLQEAVVLLDVYLNAIKQGKSLTMASYDASKRLRMLAEKNGYSFDESFRSPQGLAQRLRSIAKVYEHDELISVPATKVFNEAVELFRCNREKYATILASEHYDTISKDTEASTIEYYYYLKGEGGNVKESEIDFFQWLSNNKTSSAYSNYQQLYAQINAMLIKSKVLSHSIIETQSAEEVREAIGKTKQLFGNKRTRETATHLLSDYLKYLQEKEQSNSELEFQVSEVQVAAEEKTANVFAKQNDDAQDLQARMEQIVLDADVEGISIDSLSSIIPSASISSLKRIRDCSDKIVSIYGMMIHIDSLIGVESAAETIHEIIEKLLIRNGGYVSSQQLFEYACAEMQMFLNDNNFEDEQKVFCLAKFLFEKIEWNGYHYEFSSGRHISRGGGEKIKTNMDVFEKFARDQGGVFQWDDLLSYLRKVGIKPNNLRVQMEIGSKPIFFYYSSNGLISAESMKIDEEWCEHVNKALKRLFDDVGDHIIVRNILPNWYEQLPELPQRISWSPVLLQYVLHFYGDKLDARTIHSEMPQQYDTIHSLLVSKDSELNSFGDAVIAFIIDNEITERHFQAEKLRRLLAYGKMIGELELIGNMPRAIGYDTRFAWDAAEENVFIRV